MDGGGFQGFAVVEDEVDGEVLRWEGGLLIEPDDFDFFGFDDGLEDAEIFAGEFDGGGDEDLPGIQEEVGDFGETAHDFTRAAGGIVSFEVGVDAIEQ